MEIVCKLIESRALCKTLPVQAASRSGTVTDLPSQSKRVDRSRTCLRRAGRAKGAPAELSFTMRGVTHALGHVDLVREYPGQQLAPGLRGPRAAERVDRRRRRRRLAVPVEGRDEAQRVAEDGVVRGGVQQRAPDLAAAASAQTRRRQRTSAPRYRRAGAAHSPWSSRRGTGSRRETARR